MSDFSLFSLFTAGLAFASSVSAYTQPVGAEPRGNPISEPGLHSIVPVGQPFTVTWDPTTAGTVTLVLLKGPSTNAVPQYAIVENIENDGSYVWTPKTDLAPSESPNDQGYGIQLIDDATGQYQYTTQFGISNPNYSADSSSSASSAVTVSAAAASTSSEASMPSPYDQADQAQGGWGHGSHNVHGGWTHSASAPASGMTTSMSTTSSMMMSSNGTTASAGHAMPTGGNMGHNATMTTGMPTGGYTTKKVSGPSSTAGSGSATSASASPQASGNGAATVVSSLGSLVLAAGAAVFVL